MLERFIAHLETSQLIPPGASVLVGSSGGADSTCLLYLLKCAGVDVVAAHLHHGMRPEGDAEQLKCEEFAESLGIPFLTGKADVPGIAEHMKVGVEEAGRTARQMFFRQSANQTGCHYIATGHTQDDHIETVLMHMARGSGLSGLAGIHPSRDGIVRPLLPFRRAETRTFCEQNDFWFHDDPGNFDEAFTRVRLRRRIVPEFESINPQFGDAVARLAETTRHEDQFLNGMAAGILEQAEILLNGNLRFLSSDCEVALDKSKLEHAPEVLVRRALRLATQYIGGELEFHHVELLLKWLKNLETGSITVPDTQVVVEIDSNIIHIRDLQPEEPFRFPLTVPGETESEIFGWKLTAESTSPSDYLRENNSLDIVLDLGKTSGGLHFRSMQSNDVMVPLGEGSQKKVADLLAKAKLTSAARQRLPIIMDMIGPVWLPGVRLAERVKITEATQRALRIRLEPLEDPRGS